MDDKGETNDFSENVIKDITDKPKMGDTKDKQELGIKSEETISSIPMVTENNLETDLKESENKNSTSNVSIENESKRSRFDNQITEEEKSLNLNYMNDEEDDKDLCKRQKLSDPQPNTSTKTDDSVEDHKLLEFRKVDSSLKKRNYRNQSDSSEVVEDTNDIDHLESRKESNVDENINQEESSSSESIEFCEEAAESSIDSNEVNIFNNDWSGSEDEYNQIPDVLKKKSSKSNWSIIKEISDRQTGSNNLIPVRFYSSLHAVQRLELMCNLEDHQGCVNSLNFNSRGNLLASASDDLQVTIWDWATGKKNVSIKSGHKSNIFNVCWLPMDIECYMASSARDGQVRLIDIRNGATRKLAGHRGACHKISVHPDMPNNILSAGEDAKVFSIDIREKKPTTLLSMKENDLDIELYSVDINPMNNMEICVSGKTRSVRIYDRRKISTPLYQLYPKHLDTVDMGRVTTAIYNHNGTEVIASYNNEDIYLFDVCSSQKEGDFAHRYQGHCNNATIKKVNFFGPNSEFILSGSDCGNIFIWDKKTEAIVQWMAGDAQGIVNVLEPHPHLPILATSGLDWDIKIWIPSNEEIRDNKKLLQTCVKKNLAVQKNSLQDRENNFDGHILWFMLQHLNQSQRRRQRLNGNDQDSSNEESSINSDAEYISEDLNEDDEVDEDSHSNSSENDSSDS